jgi:hypothetical protein
MKIGIGRKVAPPGFFFFFSFFLPSVAESSSASIEFVLAPVSCASSAGVDTANTRLSTVIATTGELKGCSLNRKRIRTIDTPPIGTGKKDHTPDATSHPTHPTRYQFPDSRYQIRPPTRLTRTTPRHPSSGIWHLVSDIWVGGRYSSNRGSRNSQIRRRIQLRPIGVIE